MEARTAPFDEETRVPLPIAPAAAAHKYLADQYNLHHHYFEDNDPLLQGEAGRAVRSSRVQLTPRWLHRRAHIEYGTALLPATEDEAFQAVVLGHAEYIPPVAVDVSGAAPRLTKVTPGMQDLLRARMRVAPDSRQRRTRIEAGQFMMLHVLGRQLNDVPQRDIKLFMDPNSTDGLTMLLGCKLINRLIRQATEAIEPLYQKAYRQGRLAPNVPETAYDFVQYRVGGHKMGYFGELEAAVSHAA